jgi:beta-lactamase class A
VGVGVLCWRRPAVAAAVLASVVLATTLTPFLARADARRSETPAARQLGWVLAQVNAARTPPSAEISAHFSARFLKAVPPASLVAALSPISADRPVRIATIVGTARPLHLEARLVTASGMSLRVLIGVSAHAPNQIESLLIQPFAQAAPIASWSGLDRALERLGLQAGVFAAHVRGGQLGPVVHARSAAAPVAIGSAFKLYVLGALAEAVRDRRASWGEQLPIHEAWKSLPSGAMQNERAGTRFALRHYAEQMISVSDNTAADHLIWRLGRVAIERELVALGNGSLARNQPFLTTREMFALKIAAPPGLRAAYSSGGENVRRELLAQVDALPVLLSQAAGWTAPRSVGTIEWFASPLDLGRAMVGLQALARQPGARPVRSILALNPGIPFDPMTWRYIAFKGGSEPGVLSLTWYLERADGRAFVLSIAVNDAKHPIDEAATIALAEGAAALLAHA